MPKNVTNDKSRGFTIIEVVLVLAIAGLIFLMVFIALPALRASQRDTQRRNDSTIIAAAVRSYMKNNRGNVPRTTSIVAKTEETDEGTTKTYQANNVAGTTFAKYLVDLEAGGVTSTITVNNVEKDTVRLRFKNLADARQRKDYDTVWVITGTKCPEDGNELDYGTSDDFLITAHRSDVAIVRFLEKGGWYCLEV